MQCFDASTDTFRDLCRGLHICSGHNQSDLFTAVTCGNIAQPARGCLDHGANGAKAIIPNLMAMFVI
ncbi:hypothetical protein GCM10007920_37160 [Ciceribacter naphthalenivorans]|uniref:Uncharacterized protein n=1 Tax=Sphingomonas psychrolutea TaxID=1259676 RepID=A0ABQ6EGL2_9SPHN|nr:hypothetical protein GCM10007920_37160 [Ciceribacter naphthalenivorans]GLT06778.1 hypothetical protein GCM10007926_37160 [Sphingomonas psychrolutea]